MILDWKKCSAHLLETIKNNILTQDVFWKPTLAVILVGENPSSLAYIGMKEKRSQEVGMNFQLFRYDSEISQEALETEIRKLSADPSIHGLIVQAPLPDHIDTTRIIECIDPAKDVDGFSRLQIGNMFLGNTDGLWSCTPKGVMTLLDFYHIDVVGKRVCIIGRSNIVGKPMALMLINAWATVTSCNSRTKNLTDITRNSDIIILAIGKPGFLTRDMVTPSSVIIDVGSNRLEDGTFCGDADFSDLSDFVSSISPSPGGVGPMTVATLIENTWKAYKNQKK